MNKLSSRKRQKSCASDGREPSNKVVTTGTREQSQSLLSDHTEESQKECSVLREYIIKRGAKITDEEALDIAEGILRLLKDYSGNVELYRNHAVVSLDSVLVRQSDTKLGKVVLELSGKRDSSTKQLKGLIYEDLDGLALVVYNATRGNSAPLTNAAYLREERRNVSRVMQRLIVKCLSSPIDEILEEIEELRNRRERSKSKAPTLGHTRQPNDPLKNDEPIVSSSCGKRAISSLATPIKRLGTVSREESEVEEDEEDCNEPLAIAFGPSDEQSSKEINVLLLGESGVGKSTFINLLGLCSQFVELSDAGSKAVKWSVPVHFSFQDDSYKSHRVVVGFDKNERDETGQSATLSAREYRFRYRLGDCTVTTCFIDTPGLGDSRGVGQDVQNIREIIHYIARLKEIHGICFLLKPNESRFTVFFKYCIEELLQHLHRNALENAVVCFTHARGTLYRPGETCTSLKAYLQANRIDLRLARETTYCIDSEAVRYIAILASCPDVPLPDTVKSYRESWNRARAEIARLLEYLDTLEGHKVRETVGFNVTIWVVDKLLEELPRIADKIRGITSELENHMSRIEGLRGTEERLNEKLFVPKYRLEERQLPKPEFESPLDKGVCWTMDIATSKYLKLSPKDKKKAEFEAIRKWKENNYSEYSRVDYYYCHQRTCRARLSEHKLVTCRYERVIDKVEDENIKSRLKGCASDRERIQVTIEECRKQLTRYRNEQTLLEGEALPLCEAFMANNSIIELDQRLDALKQQKKELESHRSYKDETADASLLACTRDIERLKDRIARFGSARTKKEVSVDDVKKCISELQRLELIGPAIKGLVDEFSMTDE
ncbi:hypothetical protein GMRT_15115 [Giardia muris]|uniref:G domain-containing protein n=1 Tax=Giardia muris TaxID=5742 RepID=A0A4Z1SWS0_GIAMU|nr:hypothetical protein GMRT_15115 [Giardia muris]|eukprot:TNJ27968.1 hypothetical protein GMRT_15115 [Giardia muris]